MPTRKHNPDWVIVARIGRPFGIKGFSFIDTYTEHAEHALDLMPWWDYSDPANPTKIIIDDIRPQGKRLVGRVEDCTAPEHASRYTNHTLAIKRSQLPALDTGFYWHDLMGMKVLDTDGHLVGHIDDIFNPGSNDVWVIRHDNKTYNFAYLESSVKSIDLEKRLAVIDRAYVV